MHEDDKSASFARFRELGSDDDDINISLFVLELIRKLMTDPHQPEHEITAAGVPDHELRSKAINWLTHEDIIAIADGTVQLTPAGHQSIAVAAIANPQLSGFLAGNTLKPGPDRAQANLMVLAILKAHYKQRRSCEP